MFVIFAIVSIVSAQTCDCEELQAQIKDLNHQIDILKKYVHTPEEYESYDFVSVGNYYIKAAQVHVYNDIQDKYGRTYNELFLNFAFGNKTENTINFDDTFILRVFQIGRELELVYKYDTNIYIRPDGTGNAYLYYKLLPTSGVIEMEVFPINEPWNKYSAVIYNYEQ